MHCKEQRRIISKINMFIFQSKFNNPPYRDHITEKSGTSKKNQWEFQISKVGKIVSEYDQEIPQSQTTDNPVAPRGRAAQPSREDKSSKATSSLFPIKMIAILEWTYSNVQQNIEQLQTPTMGVTKNKKSTTTEPPP